MVNLAVRNFDRSSPWPDLGNWARDFDQIFGEMDRALVPLRTTLGDSTKRLACDIHETESNYLLNLDIPGYSKEDINVEISGNHVTVSAERKSEHTIKDATTHRLERSCGSVQRVFALPKGIDKEGIQANLENGVLYLAIPKQETVKSKKIEIGTGKSSFSQKIREKVLETKAKSVNS